MHVLLIDDEWDADSTRVEDLRAAGYEVTVINSAKEALTTLKDSTKKFDVVLLDIMMPPEGYATLQETNGGRLTGARLLQDIRRYRGKVPVIAVSAHSRNNVAEHLPELTMYLEKPIRTTDIISAIEEVCGQ